MTRIKKIIIVFSLIVVTLVALLLLNLILVRSNELEVMKPITLLEKAPQDYPKENKVVGKIRIGEKIKVLRMGHGKDFRAWKVRNSMGEEGWFVEGNGNIRLKR